MAQFPFHLETIVTQKCESPSSLWSLYKASLQYKINMAATMNEESNYCSMNGKKSIEEIRDCRYNLEVTITLIECLPLKDISKELVIVALWDSLSG